MVATAADVNKAIEDLISLLKKGLRIEAVILFGSHARGTAHEESDIDLAIISPDFEGVPLNRRQTMIAHLSVHRPWGLSPLGYPSSEYHNPGPHSFLEEIIRTGRIVYPKPAPTE
jgi:predicted nucleotidyltransferase